MHGMKSEKFFTLAALLLLGYSSHGVSGTLTYLGCFREKSKEDRLFKGDQREFRDHLSPQVCASHCEQKGFKFIGLQYSFECFCTNERPTFQFSAYENECNLQCAGNAHDKCGGGMRLSVYETDNVVTSVTAPIKGRPSSPRPTKTPVTERATVTNTKYAVETTGSASTKRPAKNPISSNYIGCFYDSRNDRLLSSSYKDLENRLTPESCVAFCYRGGYRYAGVQHKSSCFCGNKMVSTDQRVQETECDLSCPGDGSITCGGFERTSVYHTDIADHPEDDRLIGCFQDDGQSRTLSGDRIVFTENNTPRLCMNVCLGLNYKYSGVQYGVECFCGNQKPPKSREQPERECSTVCPGDRRKKCGGNWRILVYQVPDNNDQYSSSTIKPIYVPPTQRTTTTTRRPTKYTTRATTTSTYRPELLNNEQNTKNCLRSETEINGKNACKGELIFQDDFKSRISEKWAHEIIMPSLPDYEFVVFQKNQTNSFVKNGKLTIRPTIQDDNFIRRGKLELYGCTGVPYSDECARQAVAYSILPPIESARITTKDSFTFKYGTVNIRAKLPLGDWIVPEISLEPKRKVYGPSYASGKLRIAMARGNSNLMYSDEDIGNRRLESGVLMGVGENIRGRTILRDKPDGWYRSFHNYSVVWTKDNIKFLVDGRQEESITVSESTLAEVVGFDHKSLTVWRTGSRIAPFDQEFYLNIGLSVGGMRDFPDNCTSSGHYKPWNNLVVKAMANFWEDRYFWENTWEDNKAQLQIEHVSVYAL